MYADGLFFYFIYIYHTTAAEQITVLFFYSARYEKLFIPAYLLLAPWNVCRHLLDIG